MELLRTLNGKAGRDLVRMRPTRPDMARDKRARIMYAVNHANGAHIAMPNNNLTSCHHAISERINFVKDGKLFITPPVPESSHDMLIIEKLLGKRAAKICAAMRVLDRLSPFRTKMTECIKTSEKVSALDSDKFIETCAGTKKKRYASAKSSLKVLAFEPRDAECTLFTKDEHQGVDGKYNPKPPRAIQTRTFRYHLALACHLHPAEKKIYSYIDKIFDPTLQHKTVAKGMNLKQRGQAIHQMWTSFHKPVAVGLDASRWDQHQNQHLLRFEHTTYLDICDGQSHEDFIPDLEELLQHQLWNTGKYHGPDGKITYETVGKRCSGDINTSLGNGHNMCALLYSYIVSKGLLGQVLLLNDGDDDVVIMEQEVLDNFLNGMERWFHELGVTMVCEGIFYELEHIEFCQANPVFGPEGWQLVPNPRKRLYSDLVTTKDLSSRKIYNRWVGAVAGCGIASCSGLPIYQAFYNWMAKGAVPWLPDEGNHYYRFRDSLVKGMNNRTQSITWAVRCSFFHAFGITPKAQMLIEQHFDGLDAPTYTPASNLRSVLAPMMHLVEPIWGDRE